MSIKNNCADWAASGSTQNGTYLIDPDGNGGKPAFNATCYNLTDSAPRTYVHHNLPAGNVTVPNFEDDFMLLELTYDAGSYETINALSVMSVYCEHRFIYTCHNMQLGEGSKVRNVIFEYNHHIHWYLCNPQREYTYRYTWGMIKLSTLNHVCHKEINFTFYFFAFCRACPFFRPPSHSVTAFVCNCNGSNDAMDTGLIQIGNPHPMMPLTALKLLAVTDPATQWAHFTLSPMTCITCASTA